MAKVLLIQPISDTKNKKPKEAFLPLSLIYLATAIEDKHEVNIYDRNVEDRNFESFLKHYNPDIIGMPSWTSSFLQDLIFLGKKIKEILPKSTTIVGGPHATVEPKSLLDEPYIDYILRGEGEEAFLEFCDVYDKNPKKLPTLKNINYNPVRSFIDMNKLKIPNYDLVDMSKYSKINVSFSRGCPGNCKFCYNAPMWGIDGRPFVRMYTTEKAIEILRILIEKYKIKEFTISDDNFIFSKTKIISICDFLKQYKGISFFCGTRADSINDEVAKALKSAGCQYVQLGIESGSQRVLDFLNKNTTVQQNAEAIRILKKNKIFVDASFMIGLPTETLKELRQTVDFVKKTNPEHPNAKFYTLWPSELFDYCVKEGKIKKPKTLDEWANWIDNLFNLNKNVSEIPNAELEKVAHEIWNYKIYQRKLRSFLFLLKTRKTNLRKISKSLMKFLSKKRRGI